MRPVFVDAKGRARHEFMAGRRPQFTIQIIFLAALQHRANTGAEDISAALRKAAQLDDEKFRSAWSEAFEQAAGRFSDGAVPPTAYRLLASELESALEDCVPQ